MTTAYTPGDIPQFDVADRLKKALSVTDVPVGEMAEYLGITRETLSRYLNGRMPAPVAVVRLISVRTGVPLTWLQTGKAPARPQGPGSPSDAGPAPSPGRRLWVPPPHQPPRRNQS